MQFSKKDEKETIRDEIESAKDNLTENIQNIEKQVKRKFKEAGTTIRQLNPVYQTTKFPFTAVGTALATGLVASRAFSHSPQKKTGRSTQRPPLMSSVFHFFEDEIDSAKKLLVLGIISAGIKLFTSNEVKGGSHE